MAQQEGNKDFQNFLIVGFIMVFIVLVPTYVGTGVTLALTYGFDHWKTMTTPWYLYKYYENLFNYVMQYGDRIPLEMRLKILAPPGIGLGFGLITLFLARAPLIDFRPFKQKESIHGDARWATESDIRRANLRARKGILMGRTGKSSYLVVDDFQHVLLFAPTGSGKGVGFVIPNLLYWQESVVVHDIKMENYELTSGYRQKVLGQGCYVWNPADPNGVTHCYNPLDWISEKPGQMVDDCQKICSLILPEQEFWQNEARSLMLGVMLYLLAVPEKITSFGEIVRTLRSDDVVYNLAVVLDTVGGRIHPVAYMNIAAFLQKADKERSGVISTLNSGLELWANPLIDTATASSDFDVQILKKRRLTVYVGVTPDNLQRLEPLLKIFYQQSTDFLTRAMPTPDEKYGVLFMMDEFPSLGEMPQFKIGIAYFRGFKVKLFLIVQDTQQLKGIYEEAGMNSFLSNSYYRITFSANNIETANMISQMIGNKTVIQESNNRPVFMDMNPAARTKSISEASRALLLPQEVIGLPRDEQIILIESYPPIRCKKIIYYKDSLFTKRLLPKIPLPIQEAYDPRAAKGLPPEPAKPADAATGGTGGTPANP
jgi:type IV secretion system protein VirD4